MSSRTGDPAAGGAQTADETIAAAEKWFVRHGLPYFVDSERAAVRDGLRPRRLIPAMAGSALLAVGVGVLLGGVTEDVSVGVGSALTFAGIGAGIYAATTLRMTAMARWAVARTFKSLGLLFPLATRALPLLLVFVMFLFINAEVWEVGAALDGGVLWVTVLLFAGMAVAFLLARLPEELDAVDDEVKAERLVALTGGTPLKDAAVRLVEEGNARFRLAEDSTVQGFQKANLIVVLLVAQIVQVLLLSLSVLAFFIAFGTVAMKDTVVAGWIGDQDLHPWGLGYLNAELVQVSIFLAAFSGMYFTVAAITDDVYRQQFFTSVTRELDRAMAARAVYHALKRGL